MHLKVNGKDYESSANTLQELFVEKNGSPDTDGKAIAVNDRVVPNGQWEDYPLKEGDRIEIIQAVQGG